MKIWEAINGYISELHSQGGARGWDLSKYLRLEEVSVVGRKKILEGLWKICPEIFTRCWTLTEKAMAPHSSTLAWKIPWTEEPGRLQSMGLLRVRHNWVGSLSLFTFMHWRRKWQPTPVFLPGKSQGWGILVGCRLWGRTESDMTEADLAAAAAAEL